MPHDHRDLLSPARLVAACAATLLLGVPLRAQTPSAEQAVVQHAAPAASTTDRLLVLNKAGGTVSLFDPATRREVATVAVGTGPHECAVAPDGRTAVVCNYGDQRPGDSLTILDVPGARAIATFSLTKEPADAAGRQPGAYLRPHGIAMLADGRHAVVTSESARRLLVVDLAERRVIRALPTPQAQLHMVALAGDQRRAFGASLGDGTMSIFELRAPAEPNDPPTSGSAAAPTAAVTVPTGKGAEGIAVRPGHREVWVGNRAVDSVSVVDPETQQVVAELATAAFPIRVAGTPDGRHMLVSCAEAGQVQVFDCERRTLAHTIDLLADKTEQSPLPIGICIDPDGRTAWVACARGEFLAVLDLASFRLVDRVAAGPGPDGMAWARWQTAPEATPPTERSGR